LRRDESCAERAVSFAAVVRERLSGGGASLPPSSGRETAVDGKDRGARRDGPDCRRSRHLETRSGLAVRSRAIGASMNDILVPISRAELLDKITILRIKSARMTDAAKVANVRLELSLLEKTWREAVGSADIAAEEHALQAVNERLWVIEDDIRDKE